MGPLGPTAASRPPVEGAPGWASCCPSVPISHTAPHGASHLVHGLALWRPLTLPLSSVPVVPSQPRQTGLVGGRA